MTNKQAVYEYLKEKPLTTFAAFSELGVTRLAAVVSDLKKDGHIIIRRDLVKQNRYGRNIYFAEYRMEKGDEQV